MTFNKGGIVELKSPDFGDQSMSRTTSREKKMTNKDFFEDKGTDQK